MASEAKAAALDHVMTDTRAAVSKEWEGLEANIRQAVEAEIRKEVEAKVRQELEASAKAERAALDEEKKHLRAEKEMFERDVATAEKAREEYVNFTLESLNRMKPFGSKGEAGVLAEGDGAVAGQVAQVKGGASSAAPGAVVGGRSGSDADMDLEGGGGDKIQSRCEFFGMCSCVCAPRVCFY